jgi:hypothetical protein
VDSLGVPIGRADRWERFRHARIDAFRCGMWMHDKNASARFFLAVAGRAAVNERQQTTAFVDVHLQTVLESKRLANGG